MSTFREATLKHSMRRVPFTLIPILPNAYPPQSIRRLLAFPEDYRLYVGHDYPDGRPQEAMTTVLESKARNRHAGLGVSEDEFIRFRDARDVGLGSPRLLHPSLQVNIRAGKLPPRDESGRVFLRIPVLGDEALDVRAA